MPLKWFLTLREFYLFIMKILTVSLFSVSDANTTLPSGFCFVPEKFRNQSERLAGDERLRPSLSVASL